MFYIDTEKAGTDLFLFIQPMAVGFLAYASAKSFHFAITNQITSIIFAVSTLVIFLLQSPPAGDDIEDVEEKSEQVKENKDTGSSY